MKRYRAAASNGRVTTVVGQCLNSTVVAWHSTGAPFSGFAFHS